MRAGLILLTLAYVFSQFFRSFLSVLAEVLERDIGATPDDLALALGLWFLSFAMMQLPVGWALDRIGPRWTATALFLIGCAGGAALFAAATVPAHVAAAMFLIGIGCSPVLMASYYIFAREFPPSRFATLAALVIAIGSLGNLAGAGPLTWFVDTVGWRAALWSLAGTSGLISLGVAALVRNPAPPDGGMRGSVLDLLRMPAMWLIFPLMFVSYAPVAGLRGLWIGPYLADGGHSEAQIGMAATLMAVAMILGTFCYGPMDRIVGSRKWVVFSGSLFVTLALAALIWLRAGYWTEVALFSAIGFFGMSFPVIMAHGRAFFPAHLAGRGVTLMNLFGIGGVGIFQVVTGRIYSDTSTGTDPQAPYLAVFTLFLVLMLCGMIPYLFSRDRTD